MAKPGKVWQILDVNRSQNVVFYGGINYSRPGLQERGCISRRGGALLGGAFLPDEISVLDNLRNGFTLKLTIRDSNLYFILSLFPKYEHRSYIHCL